MIIKKMIGLFRVRYKRSYAQCGEDILIECIMKTLGIKYPSYLDIGTNDPIIKNNTYLFYRNGSRGVCVEPNPELANLIQKKRKGDICLNVGIASNDNKKASYYIMSSRALNTFSLVEAEKYVRDGNYGKQKIEKVIQVDLVNINTIMEKHFPSTPNIVSVDTEGLDLEIITSIDWSKFRPKVICVETARYNDDGKISKQDDISDYLKECGYFQYADTFINSIFVDEKIWSI